MTVIDLDGQEVSRGSFEVAGGGRLLLRLLTAADIRDINKATTRVDDLFPLLEDPETKKMVYRHFRAPSFDSDLFEQMVWDRTIEGWEGFFDAKGKPIPVTAETKTLLMAKSADVAEAYHAGMKALKTAKDAEDEAQKKSSSNG